MEDADGHLSRSCCSCLYADLLVDADADVSHKNTQSPDAIEAALSVCLVSRQLRQLMLQRIDNDSCQ